MIYIIYMAAGNSRRFGANKLLYSLNDRRMFEYGLETAIKAAKTNGTAEVIIVTQYPEICEYAGANNIRYVYSLESINGISYTIKAGIKGINNIQNDDYLCFMTADQPYLKESTLVNLLSLAEDNVETASLKKGDIPGNPTLIKAEFVAELMQLTGDKGGRKIVNSHNCKYIDAEPLELKDIDEIKDLDTNG